MISKQSLDQPQKIFYLLGVEGGGTKSKAVLANMDGKMIAEQKGKALNYISIGKEAAKKNLASLLGPLLKKMKGQRLYAVFGLAGLDTKKDETFYKSISRSTLPSKSIFQVVSDTKIALEAKCPDDENRIIVISGTGSNVYGESRKNQAQSIGLGDFLLGDEGSGYRAGLAVFNKALCSWDGRSKKTLLENLILQETRSKTMEDCVKKVYDVFHNRNRSIKEYIASFAPLVGEAIAHNDWAGLEIRKETIEELARGVRAVANKLHIQHKKFCIGLVGSVWNMTGLRENFQSEIEKQFPLASFSDRKEDGAWGALLLATKLAH